MPKTPRQKAKEDLDYEFSRFVRLRDSDEWGFGNCITCGVRKHWTKADAGHFQGRKAMSTRWSERNVSLQCKGCNGFRDGEQFRHGQMIDMKYGDGSAEELRIQSMTMMKWSVENLKELALHYRELAEQMLDDLS
jgi:hypothetical protein